MTEIARPLRILHLTAGSDAGGLSRYVYDLASTMIAQGHHVTVAGERGAWHELFANSSIPWIDVPLKGNPLALWRASRTLRRWMAHEPVDVLHTHYRRATLVARRLQSRHRPPILYTVHLSELALNGPRRWFSDFGDYTHVASTEARRWAIEEGRVLTERIELIPHGVDISKLALADESTRKSARHALGLAIDARVAAYVGRLDYPKNVDWLLDVAAAVPRLQLLIAGDGPDAPQLAHQIARRALGDRVHLLGHRDPLPIYQAADALLLPSLREGFSLVCAEAMAVGVAVLRTRTAGTDELIVENITGRSTPIDHDAFVQAATEFLALPDAVLLQMGEAASSHVRASFTFERQLGQTLALYRRLAETG